MGNRRLKLSGQNGSHDRRLKLYGRNRGQDNRKQIIRLKNKENMICIQWLRLTEESLLL